MGSWARGTHTCLTAVPTWLSGGGLDIGRLGTEPEPEHKVSG